MLLVGSAIFAPLLTSHDPAFSYRRDGLTANGDPLGPGGAFILGTDRQGRDYFARLVYGARVSLGIGIGANLIAVSLGLAVGLVAGYAGGRVESLLMRTTDVMLAFPVLLLSIALVAVVGASFWLILAIIALFLWTPTARIVHGRVLSIKEHEFVEAARAAGATPARIVLRHVLPHVMPVIEVYAALGIAAAILFEATLSYLGVGVPPPTPSWGSMINEHISYYATDPRLVALPGLAILFTILSFNLLADALRAASDPFHVRARP